MNGGGFIIRMAQMSHVMKNNQSYALNIIIVKNISRMYMLD